MTLLFERTPIQPDHPPDHLLPAGLHLLGQRAHGLAGHAAAGTPALLHPARPTVERWWTDATPREGRTGDIRHRSDGCWLFGWTEFAAPASGAALQATTQRMYADLFRVLAEHGSLQLQRIWNYLPQINAELDGLEVYRHFNIGRQQAFLDAGQCAFEGAPAACALGHHGSSITLAFLAGPQTPRAVENPRQISAYHYPSRYGPRSPTFSRAALVQPDADTEMLFISGTASIVGHASLHPGDALRQTEETLRNLHAVVEATHASTNARFDLARMDHTIYVRHSHDLPAVRAAFEQALGAESPAARQALYLQADVCRSELLVEIEVQGQALPMRRA